MRYQMLDNAGIPPRFQSTDIFSVKALPAEVRKPYLDVVALLMERMCDPVIIVLCGPGGPGKTHIACGLVYQSCMRLRAARYAVTADFFRAIRSQFGTKCGNEESIVNSFASPALLVLDEIQERGETEWEQRTLTNLVDRRYAQLRTTLLITNQMKAEFQRSVGESIASRVRDRGGIVECLWRSVRGALD
jgi:DNA replication protein DnaC